LGGIQNHRDVVVIKLVGTIKMRVIEIYGVRMVWYNDLFRQHNLEIGNSNKKYK